MLMARAASNYRQVRVTITEEAGNFITLRVMIKPLAASWSIRDTVYHHRFKHSVGTHHWTNLVALAASVIMRETLPPER